MSGTIRSTFCLENPDDDQHPKILLPTDFSKYSAAATKYACELASKFDAESQVLHALEILSPYRPGFEMGVVLPEFLNETRADAEKSLNEVVDPDWAAGHRVIPTMVVGSPKVEIVRYARQHDIDLIVLSTHGRTGLAHVILGSVAENVVRTAPCPVLTVRPKEFQFVMP